MRRVRVKIAVLCLCMLLLPVVHASAEQAGQGSPLDEIASDVVSFFTPVAGQVTAGEGGWAVIDIGKTGGIKEGMRFKIYREGNEFRHPVTGEVLGRIETEVGDAQVLVAGETDSVIELISGEVQTGDRVRISQAMVKALFYQARSVDWAIGDALYRKLKETGRFEIVETEADEDDAEAVTLKQQEMNTVFAVFLRETIADGRRLLDVRLLNPDGSQFYAREAFIPEEKIRELKFGYDFLKKVDQAAFWSFEVPSSMEFVVSCDVNGDGTGELVVAIDHEIEVLRLEAGLKTLQHYDLGSLAVPIWLDCSDLNGDGKSDIAVSYFVGDRMTSDVLAGSETELGLLTSADGFVRVIGNTLYHQAYSVIEGYSGPVKALSSWTDTKEGRALRLPEGVNIYDFYPVAINGEEGYFVVDGGWYMGLVGPAGEYVWRSEEKLGGFLRQYEKPSPTGLIDRGSWLVKDRVTPYGGSLLIVDRKPLAKSAQGLGFSSGSIIEVSVRGTQAEVSPVLKEVSGTVLDFTVHGDRLVVLVRATLGSKAVNLFKGKSPFKRDLYIFPLRED